MSRVKFVLIIIAVIALWNVIAAEKNPQEPHYKNGIHNKKAHPKEGDHRVDDDDESIDTAKPKCPHAPKEDSAPADSGCPYHKGAHKCPEIHKGDCPYQRDGGEEVREHWKECPEFKDKGCPYSKDAEALEKTHNCPQFKEGCPYKEGDASTSGHLKDCPKFKEGCPYHEHSSHTHRCPIKHPVDCPYLKEGSGEVKRELSECPKFKDGCPYAQSEEEMKKLPGCPVFKEGCPFPKGEKVDIDNWKKCPSFKEGCPYDLVHYEGHKLKETAVHLVQAFLTGGKIDEFVSDKFLADVIGISSSDRKYLGIDRDTFEQLLKLTNWQVTVTTVDQVADGHIVVLNSRISGTKDSKQLSDIALITFHFFNKGGKVEKLQTYFDGLNYAKQLGTSV